jgi:hypothetical protein
MDTNKSTHAPIGTAPSGNATSQQMSSSGSKGRTGGSKFKSLLFKLSGGHHGSPKSVKVCSLSWYKAWEVAGTSQARLTLTCDTQHDNGTQEASEDGSHAAVTSRNKTVTSPKHNNLASGNPASPTDKRTPKQAATQTTIKSATGNNSGKGGGTATSPSTSQIKDNTPSSSKNPTGGVRPATSAARAQSQNDPISTDYFGSTGVVRVTDGDGKPIHRRTSDPDMLRQREIDRQDGYEDDEVDGADADASIRPITPSSIDASSSFTGSTSLHSLAPTSRTFKSFRTGHSKNTASTKPTLLGNGTSITATSAQGQPVATTSSFASPSNNITMDIRVPSDTSASPPTSPLRVGDTSESVATGKGKAEANESDGEGLQAAGTSLGMLHMHAPESNRIATSIHGAEGVMLPVSTSTRNTTDALGAGGSGSDLSGNVAVSQHNKHRPLASPLRNSFIGSNLAVAPSLSAPEEESETGSQFNTLSTPRDNDWAEEHNDMQQDQPDDLHMPEAHRVDSNTHSSNAINNAAGGDNVVRSSASITFSKLPPATPSSMSSAQMGSAPGSPGYAHSYIGLGSSIQQGGSEDADATGQGIYHYPRHSINDPRYNPRASSPPPDNASMLTLASSTGGRAPSVYTAASRYRDGISSGANNNNGSIGGVAGTTGGPPSIVDTMGNRYKMTAEEDASIRAIAPSRRESSDSIGSKWSAALLSQKEGSYNATAASNGVGGSSCANGQTGGDTIPDNASYKRKTPSLRTVATTASSYYAAPSHPQTELKA